jgi:hypothetical protein
MLYGDFVRTQEDAVMGGIMNRFSNNHDTRGFEELTSVNYSGLDRAEPVAEAVYENYDEDFDETYDEEDDFIEMNATPPAQPEFSSFQTSFGETRQQSFEQPQTFSQPKPHRTYRPEMLGDLNPALDMTKVVNPAPLTPIGEIEIKNETQIAEETAERPVAFKLTNKGIVAVASFCAIVAILIALIIVNAITAAGLSTEIAVLNSQVATSEGVLNNEISNSKLAHDEAVSQANGLKNSGNYQALVKKAPSAVSKIARRENLDEDNSFFNVISRFFNNLFN